MNTKNLQSGRVAKAVLKHAESLDSTPANFSALGYHRETQTRMAVAKLAVLPVVAFDEKTAALIEKFNEIPLEDILAAVPFANVPKDEFWIEGGFPVKGGSQENTWYGACVQKLADNEGLLIYGFYECDGAVTPLWPIKVTNAGYVVNDMHPTALDKVLLREQSRKLGVDMQEQLYEFPARLALPLVGIFIVLGAEKVSSNFAELLSNVDERHVARNKRRAREGKLPVIQAKSIVIDLTRIDKRILDGKPFSSANELRSALLGEVVELLGKTSVRESRYVLKNGELWLRKSDGQPWRRQAHVRRIPADEDRTKLPVEITARHPDAEVELLPDRPARLTVGATKPEGLDS